MTATRLARHQTAPLSTFADPHSGALGYTLEGVPYGLVASAFALPAHALAQAHALALDILQLEPTEDTGAAQQAAALALALHRLGAGAELSAADLTTLREVQPLDTDTVLIRTDGSADKGAKGTSALSIGYLLNGQPYGVALHGTSGHEGPSHEGIAEREAIFVALSHARLLGFGEFRVQSDHKFHTRRYAEALAHPTRRKSDSLERLDALVSELQPHITFTYTPNLDTDAPHRLALHARALHKLGHGLALSRAERVALRRVHFALRHALLGKAGEVLY